MKAADFDLSEELKFNIDSGVATFHDNRMLILDANALGLLRQQILDAAGWEQGREILLQFGYQCGFADFMQMKLAYQFDSEADLMASGPRIHTWEGIVRSYPNDDLRFDRDRGEFYFSQRWENSYEAEQHLCFNAPAREPVCWTVSGYAAGWCSAFFGKPLIALESKCVGKGDQCCENVIQPTAAWGREAAPYIAAYKKFIT